MGYIFHALILSAMAIVGHPIGVAGDTVFSDKVSLDIGVCYGKLADKLPAPADVVAAYKKYRINRIRLYEPDPAILDALRNQNIEVNIGIRNEDLPDMAASQDITNQWFINNIRPYVKDIAFSLITIGNEVIPSDYAQYVYPVMKHMQNLLVAGDFYGIKVTTTLTTDALATLYPPSNGEFTPEASGTLRGVLNFLSDKGSPISVHVYPYFAYMANPANISLQYAIFQPNATIVYDENLRYFNLFDAMVDSFFAAMEKLGYKDVQIVVSETGWPNDGYGYYTTSDMALTYNSRLVSRLQQLGTPRRPNAYIEGYIYTLINENQMPEGVEQHFGLLFPNLMPVYAL